VKHSFATSVGKVLVVVHEASRILSISRLGAEGKPVDSTMCDWNTADLAQVLRGMSVPFAEAREIADQVKAEHPGIAFEPWQPQPVAQTSQAPLARVTPQRARSLEHAGIALRFVAVLLDSLIVFFPLGFVVGFFEGLSYAERSDGYASAGASLSGEATLFLMLLGLCYYVFAEGLTGMTLGKRIVGIRVVDEDGDDLDFSAALVRNLLRVVDGLFFYLIGAIFAYSSPRGQRIGDRAADTLVVRRS
jgi:uncharacterized RDD family membrane protein YckC